MSLVLSDFFLMHSSHQVEAQQLLKQAVPQLRVVNLIF